MLHLQVQIHSFTGRTTVGGTELVAVQRNMMRWGSREQAQPCLSSFACVLVLKSSLPIVSLKSLMLNSLCTLSSCCHLLSSLQGYHYHCGNAPQAQNTMSRVPLNSLWRAWLWVFFLNTESAGMSFCVFTSTFNCFYSCGCHIWNSDPHLRTCVFIQHWFWPLQTVCTIVFIQRLHTAQHQCPLLVRGGYAGAKTFFSI